MAAAAAPAKFKVLYFASAKAFTKVESEALDAPLELGRLFETLEERHPGIKAKVLDSSAVTLNLDYVEVEAPNGLVIKPGDEIGIIPPVSSG